MKKILNLLICCALLLGIAGCSSGEMSGESGSDNNQAGENQSEKVYGIGDVITYSDNEKTFIRLQLIPSRRQMNVISFLTKKWLR